MEKALEMLKQLKEASEQISPEGYEDHIFKDGKLKGLELAIKTVEEAIK